MSKLQWDKIGERYYENGVDRVALYLLKFGKYSDGEPWNGVTAITESPSGAEPSPFYADNIKSFNLISAEDLGLSMEAYSYPDGFNDCLGEAQIAKGVFIGQQRRCHFGLVYRTLLGNDENENDFGYKLHIIFDCVATPSEKAYSTINESPEPITHSWEASTTPQILEGYKPTAMLVLTSKKFKEAGMWNVLKYIEDILYGTETTNARLPKINEIVAAFDLQMYLRDSNNEAILDSSGNKLQTMVYS